MNIELLVALAAIFISAIVPAITNQQNNEHQIRLKKLDTFFLEKQKVYFEFADSYALALTNPSPENISKFRSATHKCFMLNANKDFYKDALECITCLENNESKEKIETLYMFCVRSLSLNLEFAIEDFEYPI